MPAARQTAQTYRGAGSNIYIDWDNDLVVVARWIGEGFNRFIQKTLDSIEAPAPTENAARSR